MFGATDLLLNMLVVILPIFIHQVVLEKGSPGVAAQRIMVASLTSVSSALCTLFPVHLMSGFTYDLGLVPLVLSFLYGGASSGFTTTVAVLLLRNLFHRTGFDPSDISLALSVAGSLMLMKQFRSAIPSRKRWLGVALILMADLVRTAIAHLWLHEMQHLPELSAVFLLVSAAAIWLSIFLIESFRQTMTIRSEVIRAEKLQVVSELAASIAHEVRNPMTVARGFAQLLLEDPQIRPAQKRQMTMIVSELDRAHLILSDFLSFARPQDKDVAAAEVAGLVRQIVDILTPYANAHSVEIRETCEKSLYIRASAEKFKQALLNIIKNAIESMPTGGKVWVSTRAEQGNVVIDVTDDGCGMTPDEVAKLGTPFYSTKTTGTGLGMTATYKVVQLMKGTIEVRSEKGLGTTFLLRIPAIEPAEETQGG